MLSSLTSYSHFDWLATSILIWAIKEYNLLNLIEFSGLCRERGVQSVRILPGLFFFFSNVNYFTSFFHRIKKNVSKTMSYDNSWKTYLKSDLFYWERVKDKMLFGIFNSLSIFIKEEEIIDWLTDWWLTHCQNYTSYHLEISRRYIEVYWERTKR